MAITRIQIRRGTAAAWTLANPVLAQGEPALETDTKKQKMGDGVTAWNDLEYETVEVDLSEYSTTTAIDSAIATAKTEVKNELLNGAGPAYDTLLELQEKLTDEEDATAVILGELPGKATKATGESEIDYTPEDADNSAGFFSSLLTSGKLKLNAAINRVVTNIKAKPDYSAIAHYTAYRIGMRTTNTPAQNLAIFNAFNDLYDGIGAGLFIDNVYPIGGGVATVKRNISIFGHFCVGHKGSQRTATSLYGSLGSSGFLITDTADSAFEMWNSTSMEHIEFFYPNQTYTTVANIIQYPATIRKRADAFAISIKI